jgi:hypothetical protein
VSAGAHDLDEYHSSRIRGDNCHPAGRDEKTNDTFVSYGAILECPFCLPLSGWVSYWTRRGGQWKFSSHCAELTRYGLRQSHHV